MARAQLTLLDYLGAIDALVIRRDALQAAIAELVPGSPWAQTVARLRCLRGIDTLSAVGLCAEVGDFERFDRAGKLMSYLGLVPSENSSGETRRQGAITKTGSRHARRLLVEAAWHYRKAPARGKALERRQDGQPVHVIAISWQAQQRLHHVWRRLETKRGKRRTIVAVAVARELAGFCWALARANSYTRFSAAGPSFVVRARCLEIERGRVAAHSLIADALARGGQVARRLLNRRGARGAPVSLTARRAPGKARRLLNRQRCPPSAAGIRCTALDKRTSIRAWRGSLPGTPDCALSTTIRLVVLRAPRATIVLSSRGERCDGDDGGASGVAGRAQGTGDRVCAGAGGGRQAQAACGGVRHDGSGAAGAARLVSGARRHARRDGGLRRLLEGAVGDP